MSIILQERQKADLMDLVEHSMQSESYITSLHKENINLSSKIKKLNDVVSKLKTQLSNLEIGKKNLIENTSKKDNELKELKNKLSKTKNEVEILKQKISSLSTEQTNQRNQENENLLKVKNDNQNLIVQLQNKITDLELQLKSTEKKNGYYLPLQNDKNISLSIINNNNFNPINDASIDNKLFITGKNELLEMKEINSKLNDKLSNLKNELDLNQGEKDELNIKLKKLQEEYNNLLNVLNNKNEEINSKLSQQSKLSNNLIIELNNNIKMRKNLEKIKIKYSNLEHSKKELENVIFIQENKVKELSTSVENISKIIQIKDKEIKDNKSYINNLENIIKKLSSEFRLLRNKKNKETEKKICLLKNEITGLKNKIRENNELLIYKNNLFFYRTKKNINQNENDLIRIVPSNLRSKNIKGRNSSLFLQKIILKRKKENLNKNLYKKDFNTSIRILPNFESRFRIEDKKNKNLVENGMSEINLLSTEENTKSKKKIINSYSSQNILNLQNDKNDRESVNNFKNFLNKIIDDLEN